MADANIPQFENRLRRITRRHRRMSRGYVVSVNHDGLLIARPRYRERRFPWVGLGMIVVGLFVFKALLYTHLGPITYGERLGKLESGTVIEQGGAYIMRPDQLTVWIAGNMSEIVR